MRTASEEDDHEKYEIHPKINGYACNPMTYIERVKPHCKIRFLVGECDRIVNIRDARNCAKIFPDNACYVVLGMGHGQINYGRSFVDHVPYFLATQLGDWQS